MHPFMHQQQGPPGHGYYPYPGGLGMGMGPPLYQTPTPVQSLPSWVSSPATEGRMITTRTAPLGQRVYLYSHPNAIQGLHPGYLHQAPAEVAARLQGQRSGGIMQGLGGIIPLGVPYQVNVNMRSLPPVKRRRPLSEWWKEEQRTSRRVGIKRSRCINVRLKRLQNRKSNRLNGLGRRLREERTSREERRSERRALRPVPVPSPVPCGHWRCTGSMRTRRMRQRPSSRLSVLSGRVRTPITQLSRTPEPIQEEEEMRDQEPSANTTQQPYRFT